MTDAAQANPLAVIEADAFCERCGFNLRSQPIWRDERLGLLVCRCPECGGHQSATGRATALTPWLNRLALLATLLWVAVGLGFVVALFFTLFGLQAMAVEGLTNATLTQLDGTPVTYQYTPTGPTVVTLAEREKPLPKQPLLQRRELVPRLGGPTVENGYFGTHDVEWLGLAIVAALSLVGLYCVGAILAAGCWFWRPARRYVWLGLPVLAAALAIQTLRTEGMGPYIEALGFPVTYDHTLAMTIVAGVVAIEVAMLALGLATGRSFVRGVLTVFAPPGVRQLFAFLWHCDGKAMPPAKVANG